MNTHTETSTPTAPAVDFDSTDCTPGHKGGNKPHMVPAGNMVVVRHGQGYLDREGSPTRHPVYFLSTRRALAAIALHEARLEAAEYVATIVPTMLMTHVATLARMLDAAKSTIDGLELARWSGVIERHAQSLAAAHPALVDRENMGTDEHPDYAYSLTPVGTLVARTLFTAS